MGKILVVARTEFANAVRTKAFLVSLLMLPLIYGIMIFIQIFANKSDVEPRKFAVIDRTGKLYPAVKAAADLHNKDATKDGKLVRPAFIAEQFSVKDETPAEATVALSDRVRSKDLYAFVEIPADATEPKLGAPVTLKYYTLSPNYRDLSMWLDAVVGSEARAARYQAAGVDPQMIAKIDRPTFTESLGLASRAAPAVVAAQPSDTLPSAKPGAIVEAKRNDPALSFIVPAVLAMLVFIVTMNAGPQLLTTVMEEKMSRISEMLLGSVSTFELMLGKLLGNAGVAMLTTFLYLGAAYGAAYRYGYTSVLTPGLIATLLAFVFISIFLFGSLYMAVGSACSDMKDAQSMMMPVMMLSMMPMFFTFAVISNPSSQIAVVTSMIPFATPMLMTMRMAMSPAPPAWQVVASIALTLVTAIGCVWMSAKIFRTGLLMHGKAPTFRELARWVIAK